jgi:hypothetical protein
MKRTILGILTAAAVIGSVGAASAQTVWFDNGMYSGGSTYGYTDRNANPQVPYADRQGFFYGM